MNRPLSFHRIVLIVLILFTTSCLYMIRSKALNIFPAHVDLPFQLCNDSLPRLSHKLKPNQPVLYIITPTYSRREQQAELTRLAQSLLHVENMVWIVAEDATACSPMVRNHLERFQIPFVHMISPMPALYNGAKFKPRGVSNRNAGLNWIVNEQSLAPGVVYFADDDNTYDIRLFQDIKKTQKISMFPVGLMGNAGISSPIVREGKIIGFSDPWFAERKYPVDMAGFAIHTDLIRSKGQSSTVLMPFKAGYEEDLFLQGFHLNRDEFEPLAEGCTKVWVWHTKTVGSPKYDVKISHPETNLKELVEELDKTGLITIANNDAKTLEVCFKDKCV